jgi:hypothetical protein
MYMYTHTDCVEIVCELLSIPNNTKTEIFLKFREQCEELTGRLSMRDRPSDD